MSDISPQKITFVLSSLTSGGAERVLISLMNGLERTRYECELIVFSERGELGRWVDDDITIHSFGDVKVKFALPQLISRLNETQPDIIVSTMAPTNFVVCLAQKFLKFKPKIIVREAVTPSSIIQGRALGWVVKLAYRILYPRADILIAPAQCIIDELNNDVGVKARRTDVLHNPVRVEHIRRLIKADDFSASLYQDNTVNFICAGRLHHQKGFDRLIESLPRLYVEHDWHLTILGEGDERALLEGLIAQYDLRDHVTLAGLKENPWSDIARADIFLLPSRWEGLPNVVLESLACGTPVIAMSEAGGIAEIREYAGDSAVRIVKDMRAFIAAMSVVKPDATIDTARRSLLPDNFNGDDIIKRFETFLD